jgi:hypothetical protein
MKTLVVVSLLSLVAAGCSDGSNKGGHVDNSATRYAISLKDDATQAKEVAKKANVAVDDQSARMQEADNLTK